MKIDSPNYTQIPNALLDRMFEFTHTEWKALSFICRQTFGWHRESHRISISFVERGAGLSHEAANNALKTLTAKGVLIKTMLADTPSQGYAYSIDLACDALSEKQTSLPGLSEIPTTPVGKTDKQPVGISDTKKESIKKKKETSKGNPLHRVFTDEWKRQWENRFKSKYDFSGKDNKQLSEYLNARPEMTASEIPPLVSVAAKAWSSGDQFVRGLALGIASFLNHVPRIAVSLQPQPSTPPPRNPHAHMGGNM